MMMRLNRFFISTCLTTAVLCTTHSHAAIQALASRVIYNANAKAATLNIRNNASQPYMVQSWLETGETTLPDNKVPFVVTPPLLKLDPKKESVLRFIYSGTGLASDRESQFWINIQEIPPKPEVENTLQLAVRSKIKLFYRPAQIDMELVDAVKKLRWFVDGKVLKLENKSPLFVTIGDLTLNNETQPVANMNRDMVPPFETIEVLKGLPSNLHQIQYTYINEYGGNTPMPPVSIK
ncbi:fimbrial biogenesis chaperone [Acinetobacter ihumii]|uniref:fimbrial biogenesis chaperone n=1 Tax=Acinetobacter ihumii TaxID=2483802 RepID=UPI001D188ECE|nr:molecular chaperone [Acinetobacter ihumii]